MPQEEGAAATGIAFGCTPFSLSFPSAVTKPGGEEKIAGAADQGCSWGGGRQGSLSCPQCLSVAMGHTAMEFTVAAADLLPNVGRLGGMKVGSPKGPRTGGQHLV